MDFERYFDDSGLTSVEFGVRYANREKDRVFTQGRLQRCSDSQDASLCPAGAADITDPPNLGDVFQLMDFDVSGADAPSQILAANPDKIRDIFYPGGNAVAGTWIRPLPGFGAQQSWNIEEETFNAYFQANFEIGAAKFNAGLRVIRTEQTASGFTVENIFRPTERITPISISNSYTEYLPSANFRYELNEDLIARASYGRTLTRPSLTDLAPSETVNGIDEGGGRGSKGNPELQPFTADNFDIGIEWYFEPEGVLAATWFYKDLNGFIDSSTFVEDRTFPRQADGVLVTGPITFTQPDNAASGSAQGIELALQKPFTFMPEGWLQDFGVIFNYTYLESDADFGDDSDDVRNSGLPGLSGNSYNAALYYDDQERLDAKLSYAWRENYLAQFADDFGVPRFIDDYGQLDFSANFKITEQLILQGQILNITEEQVVHQATEQKLPYAVTEQERWDA